MTRKVKVSSKNKNKVQGNDQIVIDDIVLEDNQESIFETQAIASIEPDYTNDKFIYLTLNGKFDTSPKVDIEKMLFSYESGLLNQSFFGSEPLIRVLLDETIILQPVSVSEDSITVMLNSKYIPDLYLKGFHRLSLHVNKSFVEVLVKVGEPEPVFSLTPEIDSVEVLNDEEGQPVNLKLTGKNFMLYYKFAYSLIDGEFGFANETSIFEDGSFETIVHIPDPESFVLTDNHSISYSTPFGTALFNF